jgi:hypothetical protein
LTSYRLLIYATDMKSVGQRSIAVSGIEHQANESDSSDRQFVQRRGRVLRASKGKKGNRPSADPATWGQLKFGAGKGAS